LLLAWFREHGRDLPWRRTRDPYAIWVSEVMLQQTRVHTVIPYWERWMERFPTVAALAAAPLDDVLAAWAGLGYYSRARNLHGGAREVVERWDGALPARAAELRTIRGIGPYTAGAVASIAHGERAPLVDGNVARVLARVFAIRHDIKSSAGNRALWERAGAVMAALPAGAAPGDLNQGLMELGATLCAPTSPRCLACPLAACCAAHAAGETDALPITAPRTPAHALPELARAALWLEADGELVLARRRPEGLFGGLWELPQGASAAEVARALGVARVGAAPVAHHDQVLSHRRLRIAVYPGAPPRQLVPHAIPGYDAIARVPLGEIHALGVAAATTAIMRKYQDHPWTSTPKRSPSSPRVTRRSSKASRSSASTSATRTSPTRRSARRKGSTSSSTTSGR
jgi:A/G-specific adenine glycosylase